MSEEKSHSGTNEPWKNPNQTAQDPANHHTDPNVIEKEKKKKDIK